MDSLQAQKKLAYDAYGEAVEAVKAAFQEPKVGPTVFSTEIEARLQRVAAELLELLKADNHALLALTARSTAGNYLYAHSVNVAIFCMHIASGLRCPDQELRLLGFCALLLDLGKIKTAQVSGLLILEQFEVRFHPVQGFKIFKHVLEIEKAVPSDLAILYKHDYGEQEARHLDKRRPVNQAAHILALCEMYEAMTHPRPWRDAVLPHDALMGLLREYRRASDQNLIKVFAERLSLYPPGSYVQLSNGEIGRVMEIHPQSPTRPTVEIQARADGKKQRQRYLFDLTQQSHVHVAHAVDETKLLIKDTKLRLEFQAGRWWMP